GFRFGRHGDATDRHHRPSSGGGADPLVNIEERGSPEMHIRHMVFQAVGEIALAVGEIVKGTMTNQCRRYLGPLVRVDAALDALVPRQLKADPEVLAAARPDRITNLFDEAQAVLKRAAILVGTLIGPR